jgi:cytochrome c biogenesis protein CcdA
MTFNKIVFSLFAALTLMTPLAHADASCPNPIRVEVFERQDCGHCQGEMAFLNQLEKDRGDLIIVSHNIGEADQKMLFLQLTDLEKMPKVTPITLIDGTLIQGFDSLDTTGKQMIDLIAAAKGKTQYTFEQFIAAGGSAKIENASGACNAEGAVACAVEPTSLWVTVPFYGPVDVSKYSLPALSLTLGFVDGFNPCAMWVLVMFLTLLAESGSRRRMFEMAGLFILAEAVMYYLILNAWMTTWDFVGLDKIVTPLVGCVALGAGSFFLWLFYKKDSSCKVGDLHAHHKTVERIKGYVVAPLTIVTALGIIGLALSVNIIEFACSIGIPQTYTKILDMNHLSWFGKQGYNALYIFMYMIDDLVVFAAALWGFDKIGVTTKKYTRFCHFLGGLIMVILGLIMLIRPTLLIFG